MVSFEKLEIGYQYDRNYLAELWGYDSYQAISRGVVTPSGNNQIILFVTKQKQETLTQYNDYIDGRYLYWEGENKHGNDIRISNSRVKGDEIYLFYREKHHMPFVYYGQVYVTETKICSDKPSEFVFAIANINDNNVVEDIEQIEFNNRSLSQTDVNQLVKCRLGQGRYRKDLIQLWGACSVTGVSMTSVLKASHIKSWKDSSHQERLDPYNGLLLIPNIDALFDAGFVTFTKDGKILVSKLLSEENIHLLGINLKMRLQQIFSENIPYLQYHRENVFIE